jgi:spore germination cell wall hydrolase CwlJ-like protein
MTKRCLFGPEKSGSLTISVSKTTMKAQVNYISDQLATWSSRALKVAGLWLVALAVVTVCDNKLNELRTGVEEMPAGYVTAQEKIRQLDCLTRNIYWEAASEPFEGKVAVAQVTMNRLESGRFGDSVCGVIYQKNVIYEKVICQFSWVCETTHKVKPVYQPLWKESELVAKKVLLENFRLPGLKDALFYHADYVSPGWKKPKIDKIGRHIFYGA